METKHEPFDFRRAIGAEYGTYLKFLPTTATEHSVVLMVSVSGTGSDASLTIRLDANTLESMAQDCLDAARAVRKVADDKLNAKIEAMDAPQSAAA